MTAPAVTFYATGKFSVPTGTKRISGPGSAVGFAKQRAVATDEHGDEQASSLHSSEFDVEEVFEAYQDAVTLPPSLGVLDGGVTLVGISVETGTQYARVTLRGKYYTADDVAPSRIYTHGIALAKAFGPTDFMGATAGSDAQLMTGSINISCESKALFDGDGVYADHEVHSGKIDASTSWMGAAPSTNAGAGWDVTSAKPDTSATDFYKWDVSGSKSMTSTTPA